VVFYVTGICSLFIFIGVALLYDISFGGFSESGDGGVVVRWETNHGEEINIPSSTSSD
jgi:hypothetical protein